MRTLSRKCKYALRALYCLTLEYERGPLSTAEIAHREQIPRKFLEAILGQARHAGLVDSRQGKSGGYTLAASPASITIGSIVRAIDGPLAPLPCASETAYRRCAECVDESTCRTRFVMKQVRDAIAGVLDQVTLNDLVRREGDIRSGRVAASLSTGRPR